MRPVEIARRFFEELWNERRLEVADEIVAPECVTHQLRSAAGPMPSEARGPEALKRHIRGWLEAFPDLRWDLEASIEQGDRVVSWVIARGTHRGDWRGIRPTGRPVVLRCAVMQRIAAGRIVEDWVLTDSLGFYQQLGLVAETEALIRQAETRR